MKYDAAIVHKTKNPAHAGLFAEGYSAVILQS